jgi:manganese transport protein
MDPANYATDLQAGSCFHFRLLWAVFFAHVCGYAFQMLVVTMTFATGRTLAEEMALEYPPLRHVLWLFAETASVATDFARVMGTAIALLILFDLPLCWGVLVTGCDTLVVIGMRALGQRKVEVFCMLFGALAALCCSVEPWIIGMSLKDVGEVLAGFVPFMFGVSDGGKPQAMKEIGAYVAVATSITGASLSPPNFFLHSALVQTRRFAGPTAGDIRNTQPGALRAGQLQAAVEFNSIETAIGIGFALVVNVIVVIMAGKVLYDPQQPHRNPQLMDMSDALAHIVGRGGMYLFALALFFGGQSATVVGTLASQYILEGFLKVRLRLCLRRFATRIISLVPALLLTIFFADQSSEMMVVAQAVVSFVVPLTLVPILRFTSSKEKMGAYKLTDGKCYALWAVCFLVTLLNVLVIVQSLFSRLRSTMAWILTSLLLVPYAATLAYLTWKPVRVLPDPQKGLAACSFERFLGNKELGVLL